MAGFANWRLVSEFDGVQFVRLRTPEYSGNGGRRIINMLWFAAMLLRPGLFQGLSTPDVIIGSSPHPFAPLSALVLALRFGVPFILEIRDLWPQTLIDLGGYNPSNPLIRVMAGIEALLYRRSSHIVTVLPFAQRYIVEQGVDPGKITHIPNGIDLELTPAPKAAPDQPVFSIVYAGAHGLANGLDVIVEAARLVQNAQSPRPIVFRLIGSGPEKSKLQEMAKQQGIDNIRFEPARPKSEIYATLADADAFVVNVRNCPLYQYGISLNKIYEYLALARPTIIASNAANNPIAESGAGQVVAADDAAGIARAALQLASSTREERFAMGLRGRRFVEERHGYDRLAEYVDDVLRHVTKTGSQSVYV